MKYLFLLISSCLILTACPTPPSCPPFNQTYNWGPDTYDGDRLLLQSHIKNYIDNSFTQSICPEPTPNSAPHVKEFKTCLSFPLPLSESVECKFIEYVSNHQSGMIEYPATIINGCDLKSQLDAYIVQLSQAFKCCNGLNASIHPNFDVVCTIISNGGDPVIPIKRIILINTTYRCCIECS
jgi:hypothetical protein